MQGFSLQVDEAEIVAQRLRAAASANPAIKYQITTAKLPPTKDVADFEVAGTPINGALVRDLAGGGFIAAQRNAVTVGGAGTGKSLLAIAIARACIRDGARARSASAFETRYAGARWASCSPPGQPTPRI